MTRLFLASIAVVSALAAVPYTVKAQKAPPQVTAKAPDDKKAVPAKNGVRRQRSFPFSDNCLSPPNTSHSR
jgi:hypothetical protein